MRAGSSQFLCAVPAVVIVRGDRGGGDSAGRRGGEPAAQLLGRADASIEVCMRPPAKCRLLGSIATNCVRLGLGG